MKPTNANLGKVFKKTQKTIARIRKSDTLFDKVTYAAMLQYISNIKE